MNIDFCDLYYLRKIEKDIISSKLDSIEYNDKNFYEHIFNIYHFEEDKYEELNETEKKCFNLFKKNDELHRLILKNKKSAVNKHKIQQIYYMPRGDIKKFLIKKLNRLEIKYLLEFERYSINKANIDLEILLNED